MMYAVGILFVFAVGSAIGFIYMWLLWRTVLLVPYVRRPVLFLALSFCLRAFLAAAALYAAAGPDAERLCAGGLGFVAARMLVVGFVRLRSGACGREKIWTS